MKTINKVKAFFSIVAFGCLILVTSSTQAKNDVGEGKKQLKSCTVQSGSVITQIGNTCEGKGDGCIANPCS